MPAYSTLLERLGGVDAVRTAIDELYVRLTTDKKLKFFFEGANLSKIKIHQLHVMKLAFTEIPKDVDVQALMLEKHQRLFREKGLNATHFDFVAKHFVGALEHLGVNQELIDEAVGVIAQLRPVFEQGAKDNNGE